MGRRWIEILAVEQARAGGGGRKTRLAVQSPWITAHGFVGTYLQRHLPLGNCCTVDLLYRHLFDSWVLTAAVVAVPAATAR